MMYKICKWIVICTLGSLMALGVISIIGLVLLDLYHYPWHIFIFGWIAAIFYYGIKMNTNDTIRDEGDPPEG